MPLDIGTKLGPYEVVDLIGAGGMGEVYRARDPRLGREVAVKVLPSDLTSSSERQSHFEREARAAAALNLSRPRPEFVAADPEFWPRRRRRITRGARSSSREREPVT